MQKTAPVDSRQAACQWFRGVTLLAGLLPTAACATLPETVGRNAVGVHSAGASYDSVASSPAPGEVGLGDALGVRISYSRRIAGGRKLWLGPEAFTAWTGTSEVQSTRADHPSTVTRWYTAALMRASFFPGANERSGGVLDDLLERTGLDIGAGIAYGRFAEGPHLIDGSRNAARRTDGVIGPTLDFGLDLRLTPHAILRGDVYFLFLKPELSFPWPDRTKDIVVAGGGLVVVF